jgi:hypothetical protein
MTTGARAARLHQGAGEIGSGEDLAADLRPPLSPLSAARGRPSGRCRVTQKRPTQTAKARAVWSRAGTALCQGRGNNLGASWAKLPGSAANISVAVCTYDAHIGAQGFLPLAAAKGNYPVGLLIPRSKVRILQAHHREALGREADVLRGGTPRPSRPTPASVQRAMAVRRRQPGDPPPRRSQRAVPEGLAGLLGRVR